MNPNSEGWKTPKQFSSVRNLLRTTPRTFFNAVHARCTGADREAMKDFLDEREAQFAASYAEAKRLFGGVGPN